jgi:hypothetical protein
MIGHNAQNDQRQSEYNWKNPDQNYHCMKAYNLWDHYQQKKSNLWTSLHKIFKNCFLCSCLLTEYNNFLEECSVLVKNVTIFDSPIIESQ